MADFPALPLFTDAYIGDTRHLTLEEHGAYLLLLMIAWRSPDCRLPNDDKRLATMLGISLKKWLALRPALTGPSMFREENGHLLQNRLTKERNYVTRQSAQQRAKAEARWNPKPLENKEAIDAAADAEGDAKSMPDGCQADAPTPIPTPTKQKEEEGGRVREALAEDQPATTTAPPDPTPAIPPGLLDDLRQAVGVQTHDAGPYWSDPTLRGYVAAWLALGLTPDRIVAEAKASRTKNPDPPDGPKALERWMQTAARAIPDQAKPQAQRAQAKPPASPEDRLNFFAAWVNGDKPLPPSAVTTSMAQALIHAGLVTVGRMRERGIAA